MSSSRVEFSIKPPARDPYSDRRPPYSEDAEQAVLAAMLIDQTALDRVGHTLDDTMFYREANRRIFRAMASLHGRGDVIDPLTLAEELARTGELESSGGKEYIGLLVDAVPTAANVEYHARIVKDKALRRRLIEVSTLNVTDAFESAANISEVLDTAEHRIFEVNQSRANEGFTPLKKLVWDTWTNIESRSRSGETVVGVPSGFTDLDNLTTGFQNSDLIIIAGRPSMGKTAFALNIAQNAAVGHGIPVAVFSLEMSKEQLVQRILTSEARVDAHRLRAGKLQDFEYSRLARAAGFLTSAPIWIDDSPAMTVLEMRSKARRLKADNNVGLVIIDYLQLMQGPQNAESRQQEISYISRSLKALARELTVPVIALSQLSRAPEQRAGEGKRPQLSDLRESGAIEQDADVVMFVYRQEFYEGSRDKDGNSLEGKAEIIIGKQRNGPTDTVNLYFQKTFTRFENYSPRQQEQ